MFKKGALVIISVLLIVILVACRRADDNPTPATPVAALPTPVATTVFATATAEPPAQTNTPTPSPSSSPTAIPPTATATVVPPTTTAVAPTATPVPPSATPNTGPPPGGSARIVFGPGATSAVLQSTLVAGGDTDTWILRVLSGQAVTVQTIASPPGSIIVRLGDMTGGVLATNTDTTGISATVPATGDYQINFSSASGAPAVGYTAQVFVPPSSGQVTPTRIQFTPGASVAQLNDSLAAGGDLNQYVLRLGAGQRLTVGVYASPPAQTTINIRDSAGRQISSGTDMSGASATTTAAGDYTIDISNGATSPAVSYLLTVSAPPPPTGAPQRIEFGPGQTSATLNGLVRAGVQSRYVLRAAAGQILVINLAGQPVNTVDVVITDAAGAVLNSGRDPLSGMVTDLPVTGDYTITLSTLSAADAGYVMDVIVPPPAADPTRIQFAPGATSATVTGALLFGGDVDTWVVRAAAGQRMSIGFNADKAGWIYLFVYDAAGRLIAYGEDTDGTVSPMGADGVVFPVPADGDYTIIVSTVQAAPAVNYSMAVDLPPATAPQPVRIEFGPGQTSAALDAEVVAGGLPRQYAIRVAAGQTLITRLNDTPAGNVEITISDASGRVYNFGRSPTELGTRAPQTGDYLISLSTAAGTPIAYTLTVMVPPLPDTAGATRIIFAQGSTTTTVSGDLAFGGDVDHWVINGQAGRTMTLYLGASLPGWTMVYVYNAAGDIIARGSDTAVIAAPLATTDDYRIVVAGDPAAGPIGYSMVVEIP